MILIQLFISFFKIGLIGFGGGMAIIGLIQQEVETYGWMSQTEFVDVVAISQMTPGPIGINCATYTGYSACIGVGMNEWLAILGSVVATTAIILPSLIIMLILSKLYFRISGRWSDNKVYQWTMLAIRFVVLLLIAQAAYSLFTPESMRDMFSYIIFAVVLILSLLPVFLPKDRLTPATKKVTQTLSHPIFLIILSGLAGYILYGNSL